LRISALIFFVFIFSIKIYSQADSLQKIETEKRNQKKIYSRARKASIMSAALPGLGQAYNKKYWKIPIVYAGLGGLGYLFKINNDQFVMYRDIVRQFGKDNSLVLVSGNNVAYYQQLRDKYRKPRDFAIIGIVAFYLINIVDANVDAHLSTFDVSDDLSLEVKPYLDYNTNFNYGLSLKFKIGK
jgi:hypothetical protein